MSADTATAVDFVHAERGPCVYRIVNSKDVKWLLVVFLVMAVSGCSKDAEVADFIKENESLVAEIKSTRDPDAARAAFDGKKDALRAKLEPLRTARGFQVKQESMTALTKNLASSVTSVCGLQISALGDAAKSAKYKALCDDYTQTMRLQ